jgi:hypothetical protein
MAIFICRLAKLIGEPYEEKDRIAGMAGRRMRGFVS